MRYFSLLPMLLLALLIGGCSSSDDGGDGPTDPVIPDPVYYTVNTSADAPDMNSIDAVWNGIDSVVIPAGRYPTIIARDPQLGGVDLVLKAIVNGGVLYLYTQWPDADADLRHYYLYKNAAEDFSRYINRGEDKIYVMFDNRQNGTERADCAAMCHLDNVTKHFTAGGYVDVWVWKSSTTYPAFVAEDTWWDEDGIITDYPSDLVRYPLYRKNFNFNAVSGWPYFHHTSGPDFAGPFLYFDDTTTFNSGTDNDDYAIGDTIPAFVIDSAYHDTATVLESRWEALTYAAHAGGKWTVVFARELDPDNADDLDLSAVDTLQVSIGLNDNHPYNSPNAHSCTFPFYMIIPD